MSSYSPTVELSPHYVATLCKDENKPDSICAIINAFLLEMQIEAWGASYRERNGLVEHVLYLKREGYPTLRERDHALAVLRRLEFLAFA